jgi:pyruvate kinase
MQQRIKKTKIVATLGPACSDRETLIDLIRSGVNVFRFNFSHGSHEDHLKIFERIQAINEEFGYNVSTLADLQGPKLRIGHMENDGLPIQPGDVLTFTNEKCIGNKDKIYMSYELFPMEVKVGEKVLVDDGKIELEVLETNLKDTVKLKVLYGDMLSSRKGVNLPDTNISLPSVTEKDAEDLAFVLQYPFNWVALSFVRNPDDITDLRSRIKAAGHHARIIAKIEKPEAIRRISEIIDATDAVMVARGDLGIEMPMERLPTMQYDIIKQCLRKAKPVIVATQMMDSMITNPSPTRAEVNDVAIAVLEGADAVMLSGETSVGRHPVKVVQSMAKIISYVEQTDGIYYRSQGARPESPTYQSDSICFNACNIAKELNASSIIGMTKSGYTGFQVSSCRPKADIYIFSSDRNLLGTLNLVWGTRCFFYDKFTTTDETISDVQQILKAQGCVDAGDVVINIGSMPLKDLRRTNMLKVTTIE